MLLLARRRACAAGLLRPWLSRGGEYSSCCPCFGFDDFHSLSEECRWIIKHRGSKESLPSPLPARGWEPSSTGGCSCCPALGFPRCPGAGDSRLQLGCRLSRDLAGPVLGCRANPSQPCPHLDEILPAALKTHSPAQSKVVSRAGAACGHSSWISTPSHARAGPANARRLQAAGRARQPGTA